MRYARDFQIACHQAADEGAPVHPLMDGGLTATEVRHVQRAMQPPILQHIAMLEESLNNALRPAMEQVACHIVLGFCVPENRSPKRLARLKHSMTVTTIQSWRNIQITETRINRKET